MFMKGFSHLETFPQERKKTEKDLMGKLHFAERYFSLLYFYSSPSFILLRLWEKNWDSPDLNNEISGLWILLDKRSQLEGEEGQKLIDFNAWHIIELWNSFFVVTQKNTFRDNNQTSGKTAAEEHKITHEKRCSFKCFSYNIQDGAQLRAIYCAEETRLSTDNLQCVRSVYLLLLKPWIRSILTFLWKLIMRILNTLWYDMWG